MFTVTWTCMSKPGDIYKAAPCDLSILTFWYLHNPQPKEVTGRVCACLCVMCSSIRHCDRLCLEWRVMQPCAQFRSASVCRYTEGHCSYWSLSFIQISFCTGVMAAVWCWQWPLDLKDIGQNPPHCPIMLLALGDVKEASSGTYGALE